MIHEQILRNWEIIKEKRKKNDEVEDYIEKHKELHRKLCVQINLDYEEKHITTSYLTNEEIEELTNFIES